MTNTRVNGKRQITLPKSVLERLDVKASDRVEFVEHGQGAVLLRSIARDIRKLKGMVPKPAQSVSVETMNLAITKMGRP
jgi:AbrB family looped-hinge helix DNA binding protein